jgi:4-amino-4-deoxy-L-arabinose transferase-like glycosyltransferase
LTLPPTQTPATSRSTTAILVILIVAVAILYAFRLDHTPPYLHRDEAVFALQSASVAATGRDMSGRLLPLYFEMPLLREHVWFQPMLVYVTAALLQVLPLSQSAVRLPSAAIGTLDVLLLYFLASRLFCSRWYGLAAAILLALTPAHVIHSRLAMDFIYPLPFVLGWLLCLVIYVERPRLLVLFAGTSLLGIGFYSYIASVMMMPIYLLLTWYTLFATSTRSARPYVAAAAGFAWPLIWLAVWLPAHASLVADTLARYHISSGILRPTALTDRISVYWRFFDPAFLFLVGGYTRMTNSTRLVGVFLLPLMVFIPLGVMHIANRRRMPIAVVILLGFFLAPIAAVLAAPEEPYASDRELALLPFGVLIATFGIQRLLSQSDRRRTAALGLLVMVPLHFLAFELHYFGDYHRRSAFWFEWNRLGGLEQVIERASNNERPIFLSNGDDKMMEAYWRLALMKHHREALLQRTTYFDARQIGIADLPTGALLLINRRDAALAQAVASGQLHQLDAIPEPGDPPYFFVVER